METFWPAGDALGPAKVIHIQVASLGLKAVLVIDNVARGPAIGGLRMAPDVSTAGCLRLARAMTLKNAAAGLAYGGGKSALGGIPLDEIGATGWGLAHAAEVAERALAARGVLVVPDFIANAGGVICAAMEYAGAAQQVAFDTVAEKVRSNTEAVLSAAHRDGSLLRTAALAFATERVMQTMRSRRYGIF